MSQLSAAPSATSMSRLPRAHRMRTALIGGVAAAAVLVAPAVGPARAAAITTSLGSVATASPSSSGSSSGSTLVTSSSA